jgi:hypothetical protein
VLLYNPKYWNNWPKRIQLALYLLAATAIFQIKLNMGKEGWYDSNKLGPVLNVKPREIIESFRNGGAHTMIQLMIRNYWIAIPMFITGAIMLLRLGQLARLALTLAYAAGFFSLVCLTYRDAYGRELLFYMESEWMAWSIILATPFVLHLLPVLRMRGMLLVTSLIFLVRLGFIYRSYTFFNQRYHVVDGILESLKHQGINKAILIAEKSESNPTFLMDWGAPYESVLLSAIKGYKPQVTFRIAEPSYQVPTPNTCKYISPFLEDSVRKLNNYYYHIDSTSDYKVMKLGDVLRDMPRQ